MVTPRDFPPLKVCQLCKRIFVNCENPNDEDGDGDRSIWKQDGKEEGHRFEQEYRESHHSHSRPEAIWDKICSHEGYSYKRTRKQLECSAKSKCVFCVEILRGDPKYKERDAADVDDGGIRDGDTITYEYGPDYYVESDENQSSLSSISATSSASAHYEEDEYSGIRPSWWPPEDEELEFEFQYSQRFNHLDISGKTIPHRLSWALFTTEEDPAGRTVKTVPLHEHNSPKSLELARQWQTECLSKHGDCHYVRRVKLPSRLVRVSSLGEPESARLCKTSRQKGRYCALSYCWGPPGSQPLATMQDNYSAYLEKLPYNDLPKTILDAFQVTRNMGLSYIWIDSLCIIQNDAEDTQKELGKMLRIYRNAQFTISAASASNCKQGFLKVLPLQDGTDDTEGPFFLPLRVDENTMGSVLVSKGEGQWYTMRSQEQPINKRAWTLQEALLTPRLLIFTSLHMVWRCQSGFRPAPVPPTRPEDLSQSMLRAYDLEFKYINSDSLENSLWAAIVHHAWGYTCAPIEQIEALPTLELRINFMNDTSRDTSSSHIRIWRYILQNYTNRELTKETDKLVAISAIAETFGLQSASDYLAGLWRQNLIGDLLWAVDPDNYTGLEVSNSGSPSWSWAAVKGKIQFQPSNYLGSSLEETAEVLACSVMHESVQAPFGAVRGGELIVRGYLKEMQLTSSNKLLREVQTGRRIVVEYQSDGYQYTDGYKLKFFGDRKSIQVWCLTLGNSPPDMFDVTEGGRICQAILLIRSRDYTGCYQRLGFIQDSDAPPFWWEQCEKKAVTIV